MIHDVGVPASAVTDVVERSSFYWDVGRVDASSTCGWELSSFKLSVVNLVVASVVASVVEVDIGISPSPVDSVVALLGSQLN